jgi:hypothetical protein
MVSRSVPEKSALTADLLITVPHSERCRAARPLAGAACCQVIELPRYKAAPLQGASCQSPLTSHLSLLTCKNACQPV